MRVLLALFLSGCGVNAHVDTIESKPVDVYHHVEISFPEILQYCQNQCTGLYHDETQTLQCTNDCYANFLKTITSVIAGGSK